MDDKMLIRKSLRDSIRLRRCALTNQEQTIASLRIVNQVMNNPRVQAARTVAIFLSFDGEINTQPIIKALWLSGKQIYLPVLHPFSIGYLLFLHYTANTHLVINQFKIREPCLDITTLISLIDLDIVFTPLVAFNEQGYRLGMGRGFYDRMLKHWYLKSRFYPIGLAHDCQRIEDIFPVEKWDIVLPEIITPSHTWLISTGIKN
ncbi:5-formyltetrahydrofolate cyclo-ligase [Candidatus Curculioniphilus buchneri]|uniref:5-formyltetrahydrofolate cyclo-ligase n=1 Tax=Candidatus Curculioniphilus buchneri TaxID=690594 RepID=UPI00376F12B2